MLLKKAVGQREIDLSEMEYTLQLSDKVYKAMYPLAPKYIRMAFNLNRYCKKNVVVKFIGPIDCPSDRWDQMVQVERFKDEFQTVCSVRSPYIVILPPIFKKLSLTHA